MDQLSIRNFRDLHGYVNKYGEQMKPNKIFRGASLDKLSDSELDYFVHELNIRYILDYRDEGEAMQAMDRLNDELSYYRICALQLEKKSEHGFDFKSMLQNGMNEESIQKLQEYLKIGYATMPFHNAAYQKLFELLLRDDGHVYFHCTAGKDRTGVSAFLIMMALGMSEEDGIKEYMKSNDFLKKSAKDLAQTLHIPEKLVDLCEPLLFVQEESIQCTIDAIHEKYIDYDTFFEKEYNLDKEKRKRLRSIYCEAVNN